jgi:hypothetical protein
MPTYQVGHDETLAEGSYDFTVVDAIEKQSQNGNTMIELQLMVGGSDGGNGGIRVFDHLVFTPKSYWKIDAFRIATGEKLTQGQTVSFEAEDCIGRTGKLWLTVERYEGRNRNKVGEYLDPNAENPPPAAPSPKKEPPSLEEQFGDDDLPMK